jgi:hypothetical protein
MVAFRVSTRKDHSLSFVLFISGKRQKGTTVCELLDEVRSTPRTHLLRRKHVRAQALLRSSWCNPPKNGNERILPHL